MDIMMMTVAGLLVLAILVAIFNWINGRSPPEQHSTKEATIGKNVAKANEKNTS